jgi:hypothetical protein
MLCYSQVRHLKITHNFIRTLLTAVVIFRYTQQVRQQSPTFEQHHVLLPGESWFPSSIATGAQVCVMPYCPCNGVDAGCLSADQTGENLMEHIEACQMCIWITDVSWTSTAVLNNTKNCEFLLWSISSHKKKNGKHSASPWPCQATHKYVHHWGHDKILMDSVATLTLQCWPQTIIFSPFLCVSF